MNRERFSIMGKYAVSGHSACHSTSAETKYGRIRASLGYWWDHFHLVLRFRVLDYLMAAIQYVRGEESTEFLWVCSTVLINSKVSVYLQSQWIEWILYQLTMHLIVDTDAGADDAVALLMALHAFPGDQVVGITTVFGNVDVHQANHNVAHILKAAGCSSIPVFSGASKAIVASVSEKKWEGHGLDGLGGESGKVEASLTTARRNEAVHALIDLSHKHSGELVIAAIGPLTNIALAILLDPNFMANVKQLVVMGGRSCNVGKLTSHVEFNVGCDPEATNIVYQHCTARTLYVVPFETCLNNSIPWDTFDQIFHENANASGTYVKKIWKFARTLPEHEGFCPCDAYAIAVLLHTEYIKTASALRGYIHLAPDEKRGINIWDELCSPEKANVTLVTEIDTCVFVDLLHHLAAKKKGNK